jgi:hypothetical protein
VKVSVAYAFILTYLSPQCRNVVSQRALKAKMAEHFVSGLPLEMRVNGIENARTRILKFTSFIKERNDQFVDVAGAK